MSEYFYYGAYGYILYNLYTFFLWVKTKQGGGVISFIISTIFLIWIIWGILYSEEYLAFIIILITQSMFLAYPIIYSVIKIFKDKNKVVNSVLIDGIKKLKLPYIDDITNICIIIKISSSVIIVLHHFNIL